MKWYDPRTWFVKDEDDGFVVIDVPITRAPTTNDVWITENPDGTYRFSNFNIAEYPQVDFVEKRRLEVEALAEKLFIASGYSAGESFHEAEEFITELERRNSEE